MLHGVKQNLIASTHYLTGSCSNPEHMHVQETLIHIIQQHGQTRTTSLVQQR